MRSAREGRLHGRRFLHRRPDARTGERHRPGPTRVLAIDLGSSGTRAWVPEQGLVPGGPAHGEAGTSRPVRRGRIVDAESCAGALNRLADLALGPHRQDSVIVLSRPVLAGQEHRASAREVLAALGPSDGVVIDSASAAAACAGGPDGGPVLVVDMGAELTEVALLVDGAVVDARQAEAGLSDFEASSLPAATVRNVLGMVTAMWREDRYGAVRGALRRGPVLTGGGALRSDVTGRIAAHLGVRVRVDRDPATAVVRGAALILDSVLGAAGAGAVPVVPVRLR
ncbi:rod shape-determining protein [Streptomyces sp. NPDC102402]|uniref:rod shape-determining protein n=1 Tax=Streptomyces sp. NPDC102402 TaxID=3366169 RepID=UPI00380AE33A